MESILKKPKMQFAKTHPDAKLPQKNHKDDAGWDVFAVEDAVIPPKDKNTVPVGLKLAYLDPGYWIQVSSRSGLSFKHNLLAHPGVIDNGYRGDMGILLYNHGSEPYVVKKGDRVAQLVLHFNVDVDASWGDIQNTERGQNGFGSSGK